MSVIEMPVQFDYTSKVCHLYITQVSIWTKTIGTCRMFSKYYYYIFYILFIFVGASQPVYMTRSKTSGTPSALMKNGHSLSAPKKERSVSTPPACLYPRHLILFTVGVGTLANNRQEEKEKENFLHFFNFNVSLQ